MPVVAVHIAEWFLDVDDGRRRYLASSFDRPLHTDSVPHPISVPVGECLAKRVGAVSVPVDVGFLAYLAVKRVEPTVITAEIEDATVAHSVAVLVNERLGWIAVAIAIGVNERLGIVPAVVPV